MSDAATYYGWAFHRGRWVKLCGPLPIGEAARELSRVLRVRGWHTPTNRQALTTGAVPTFDPTRRYVPVASGSGPAVVRLLVGTGED